MDHDQIQSMAENLADSFTDAVSNGSTSDALDIIVDLNEEMEDRPLSLANVFREQFLSALQVELMKENAQQQKSLAKPRAKKR